ncbi:MAG: histidine kinase, partial [Lachnospiraceae bacterium]|nr:histidine kinase [Lachnospiraceae bacterium]
DPDFAQQAQSLLPKVFEGEPAQNRKLKYDRKTILVNAAPISSIDCILVSHSDLTQILVPVRQTQLLYMLLLFICISLSCLMTIILVNRLFRRTNAINAAICQIRQGDFDIALPVKGNDFIDQIADNLNTMASQISNLIRNNYEKQLQIKNLQIRMLSQQISPHFLYNTLECLKMQAVLNDEKDTAQALTSLGHLLRYYANNASSFSTVQREIEAAQDYVNIMNLIEGRKCVLSQNVSEDCLCIIIPPFILQPIIENSIKHGAFSRSCEVHIHLTIERSSDLIHLEIADNGVGISPETLEQIQTRLKDGRICYQYGNQQASIGLYNTNARIKLFYGDSYGLSLSSIENEGTSVQLTLPVSGPDGNVGQATGEEDLYV